MVARATGAPRSLTLLCAIALLVVLVAPAHVVAQAPALESPGGRAVAGGAPEADVNSLKLLVGRSAVVSVTQPITRVSLTRPEIADALVTGARQLLVHGKAPGTISMFVWDAQGGITRYDVMVTRDLSQLNDQLKQLFPGDTIAVAGNGKDVVLSGTVSSKYVVDKAIDVAAGYVEKKEDVVNLLRQQEGVASNQVLLRVRFAEVSRTALTELGASFFTSPLGYKNWTGRTTTEQFPAPIFDSSGGAPKLVFSDYLNLFLFNNKEGLGTLVRALQTKGLFQSLAEPNLVAENGKEASFLAGGEYPYPVVQGTGGTLAITIVFKEYGIRLNFLPTIVGSDLVHLKVRPEVSTLDFSNAVTYQGFRIPALTTRRAETEVELNDGQTFAIAGLINNTVNSTMQKIPGIGDIPILGLLFRSKAAQKGQTELVVMITPQILRRGSLGAATGLPNLIEPYLAPPKKTFPQPTPRMPGGAPQQSDNAPAPAPVAGAAAAPAPLPAAQPAPTAPAATYAAPTPAPVATATTPAAQPAPVVSTAPAPTPAAVAPPAAARQVAAAPAAPPVDAKALEAQRKAEAKAEEKRKAEEQKAAEREAKALREKQEAEGRELARQREVEEKRRQEEAKATAERQKAEAKAAEERKRLEAKAADEKRKADIKRAEAEVNAQRARLEEAKKQAEEARKAEGKLAKDRAKRDEEIAKQAADLQKRQADAEKKRAKEIQDAIDRLNAAQAAYNAALQKAKQDGGQQHQ